MLRRRILASAMASVMALGSVAVVANAEETVNSVKTKADLEAYVASFDGFRTNEINDYGSVSGDRLIAMLDFAEGILEDPASTVDDYTVAYKMIEAVYNRMTIYTAEELQALIDANTKIYETNNVMNEEFGDAIYKDDKNQWGDFTAAYDEAVSVIDSADSRLISDAYEQLAGAKAKLAALPVVTKAQFRTALKNLEAALQNEYKYDAWRRGTMVDNTWAVQWAFDSDQAAWGTLYYACQSQLNDITTQYKTLDERKSVNKTSNEDIVGKYDAAKNLTVALNSFVIDDVVRGSKSNVSSLLKEYRGQLVYDYATTAAQALFDEVVAKGVDGDKKVKVLVEDGDSASYQNAAAGDDPFYVQTASIGIATAADGLHPEWKGADKTISAEISVKTAKTIYLVLNEDGFADIYTDGAFDEAKVAAAVVTDKPSTGKYKQISKNSAIDLTQYIKVAAADVTTGTDNHQANAVFDGDDYAVASDHWSGKAVYGSWILQATNDGNYVTTDGDAVRGYVDLAEAMALAEHYLTATKDTWANQPATDIYDIDTTGAIADDSAKGSSAEWTLVYRYLKYALEDKYNASTGTHTKAEVIALIETTYDVTEATGDAAMFSYNHKALVDVRQDALAWVKSANKDKKYKDNLGGYEFAGNPYATATDVYNSLNGAYWALKNDYDAFNVSFGDMYLYIAEVAAMIDDEDLEATPALVTALDNLAYNLVVVQSLDDEVGEAMDNDAFIDNAFQHNNRVFTKGGEYYKELDLETAQGLTVPAPDADHPASTSHNELLKAYNAVKDEVAKQTTVTALKGDVDGNGSVNVLDASALLINLVNGVSMDAAVADYDANGAINVLDASAILVALVNA